MGTQENGLPGNIVFLPSVSITSSTDATPIVVTAIAHGLTTGDACSVYDHTVNTNADGEWIVNVLTADTFELDGSVRTGAGAGGATGTIQPLGCGATFQIPADGDPRSAASVGVPFEALADRTALLTAATGSLKLAAKNGTFLQTTLSSVTPSIWASLAVNGTPAAWAPFAHSGTVVTLLTIHGIQASDYIDFWLQTSVLITYTATSLIRLSLGYSLDAPGVSPTPAVLAGYGQSVQVQSSGSMFFTINLRAIIAPAARAGTLSLYIGVDGYTGASTAISLIDEWSAEAKVFRPTRPGAAVGFPQ